MERLGTGIGWRPEIADDIERLPGIDWVEVVAENICDDHLPDALRRLLDRGTAVVPHGVSLGLGGAERPEPRRLAALAARAELLGAPLVTEHIAFVRAGGPLTASPSIEAGHLLPVPRTREALDVLCENVRIAQDALPVPLALENIAALISWPDEELTEGQFLSELVERTGVRLLIDVANLHTNHVNRGEDPALALAELPLSAIAYVHVAGGVERDGVWHDSHAHPVSAPVLDVLARLCAHTTPPGVLLERDDDFPPYEELAAELDAIRTVTEQAALNAAVAVAAADPAGAAPARGKPTAAGRPTAGDDTPGVGRTAARTEATAATAAGNHPAPSAGGAGRTASGVTAENTERAAVARARRADDPSETDDATEIDDPPTGRAETSAPADAGGGEGAGGGETAAGGAVGGEGGGETAAGVRERLALAQTALLSALVAGTPAPEGFDRRRLRVQSRALAAKRAEVVAKVAPELPRILGPGYRASFLRYAHSRPMTGGYRRDALSFAEHLLATEQPRDAEARRQLTDWWRERSGPAPRSAGTAARLVRAAGASRVARAALQALRRG
ncbi:DUF692 domain-containing protein [Streptomyces sp. LX-29]|uniref:DUF692 domain-containing protein n=1 Tax=Streptomyces sp. LX-29 TaxID=2900152 RepID=UPI00240D8BA3|nr:DUF692 domain-containing protein [Streptomyces sp. LX-29]WFB06918.1 DUF692 domain-containing protein [Streptomyces sp. LX-29]